MHASRRSSERLSGHEGKGKNAGDLDRMPLARIDRDLRGSTGNGLRLADRRNHAATCIAEAFASRPRIAPPIVGRAMIAVR